MPAWLKDAVFYEIYPQSFQDTNGDGIGDFAGIIRRLPYIRDLGCNALWINPCFDSPFKDAGYDVRDYQRAAPRYGTNEDLFRLFDEAHRLGIRVLLDLVPGHTSEEHPWFLESSKAEPNALSDRYIWTDDWITGVPGYPYIGGEAPRNGTYMLNFFKCQPALNYGWGTVTRSWQTPCDAPEAIRTREAMKDVMRFWLDHGCDGFRVDMASSLVKADDAKKSATCRIWQDVRRMLDAEYPEAAMVAEWSDPDQALTGARFDMDFCLDHPGNAYHMLCRVKNDRGANCSFIKAGSGADAQAFLAEYLPRYERTRADGYISFITCNHDTPRLSPELTERERKLLFAMLFTLPGVPFLYYGDEIGMRYQPQLPSKEGGYTRTGTRTPMQWDGSRNLGFSEAGAEQLYLPVDGAPDAPTVQSESARADSLFHLVQEVLALRHAEPDLQADALFRPVYAPAGRQLLVYARGTRLVAVNPSCAAVRLTAAELGGELSGRRLLLTVGEAGCSDVLTLGAQSLAIL